MAEEAGGCGDQEQREASLKCEFYGHLGYLKIAKEAVLPSLVVVGSGLILPLCCLLPQSPAFESPGMSWIRKWIWVKTNR